MNWWQILLFPFAIIYDLITRLRNHLYNIQYSRAYEFEANVINVGNLAAGGTGKSPMVIYILNFLLQKGFKVASLSRGYGRKTKGFFLLNEETTPQEGGDEPVMIKSRFGEKVMVSVGEDRALAIPQLLFEDADLDAIVLDDAFQHRSVIPSFNIMLTSYQKPFYRDYVLPSGLLREARKGSSRADVICVTKCPENLSEKEKENITARIKSYAPGSEVYFCGIRYGELHPVFEKSDKKKQCITVAALADSSIFENYVSSKFNLIDKLSFRDHHDYTEKDIEKIRAASLYQDAMVITTEKDAVKLKKFSQLKEISIFYVPIKTNFLDGEKTFQDALVRSLKKYDRNF